MEKEIQDINEELLTTFHNTPHSFVGEVEVIEHMEEEGLSGSEISGDELRDVDRENTMAAWERKNQ